MEVGRGLGGEVGQAGRMLVASVVCMIYGCMAVRSGVNAGNGPDLSRLGFGFGNSPDTGHGCALHTPRKSYKFHCVDTDTMSPAQM